MIEKVIKVGEVILHGLNSLFVRFPMEVDLKFPLPSVLLLNNRDNDLIFVSYKKLFEVCLYCGRMRLENHVLSCGVPKA